MRPCSVSMSDSKRPEQRLFLVAEMQEPNFNLPMSIPMFKGQEISSPLLRVALFFRMGLRSPQELLAILVAPSFQMGSPTHPMPP